MRRRKFLAQSTASWLCIETLEQRRLLSASPVRLNNIGYFASESEPKIERFDINTGTWMTPIVLQGATTGTSVLHVDADGIYTAVGNTVYRNNLDGTARSSVVTASNPVLAIHADGNLLFVNQTTGLYARFISVNKSTKVVIDQFENYVESVYGSSIATGVNRIIGRSQGISPSDITYVAYDDRGHFTRGGDSSYHGDYPGASRTWVAPEGDVVVDNAGMVYSTDALSYVASLGTGIQDVDFLGQDVPIVLSGSVLTAYSQAYLPTGSVNLDHTPSEILVGTDKVFTFTAVSTAAHGAVVHSIPLSDLKPATPGEPINPIGVSFVPDKIEKASDGTVLIFSAALRSIFRWDPETQTYGQTIPLIGSPDFEAYSSVNNTVYLAYHSGVIRKIDLNADNPVEVPFAALPQNPIGLATAGEFVFAADPSGAWGTHYTFSPAGKKISAVEWNYYSTEYIWNPANRRMYFFRDDTSPNDLIYEEISATGVIGNSADSPLHDSAGFQHPIRVSPDGNRVILGSGVVHDAQTLQRLTSLANSVTDIGWLSDRIVTIRQIAGVAQVQSWNSSTLAPEKSIQFPGTAVALIALSSDKALSVTRDANGVPEYRILDSDLVQAKSLIGFSIQETDSSTTVSEGGTADSFTIVLNSQPTSDVVINVIVATNDEIQVPTTAVTFTPQNWNTPQVVTVTGVDDNVADLDQLSVISLSVNAALSDSAFAGVATQSVVTTTLDNEGDFGGILPAIRVNNIAYLVHRSTSQIERFDVEHGVWLAPIIPAGGSGHPTAALVNEFGIYLAFGKAVFRYSLDGTQRTHVVNAEYEVHAIHSDGNLLFLNQSNYSYARFISVSASTNTIVDTIENYVDAVVGSAIAPRLNRIIGRSVGVSPADITYVDYDDSGHFTSGGGSSYHGDYPGASRTWVAPEGGIVVDDAGIVYSTDALRYVASFGMGIQDIDFLGQDVPIVLSGSVLTAYSQAYLPTGSVNLDHTPSEILVGTDQVFTFTKDSTAPHGAVVHSIPLSDLKPATPGEPVNPIGVSFAPDKIETASDGTVLIFSAALRSIFRWNPETQTYGQTIPLIGSPDFEAYSSVTNTVYLAYHSGLIRKIDLNAAEPAEVPFASLSQNPVGLATAGEFVFAAARLGYGTGHFTFSPTGASISAVEGGRFSTEYIWNSANRRMYFFRDDTSPNDLHYETISASGRISGAGESPLHGSAGFQHPIRVSPYGNSVILGSGVVHDARTLQRLTTSLANSVTDIAWLSDRIVTIRQIAGVAQVQSWNSSTLAPEKSIQFPGTAVALIALSSDQVLSVTRDASGIPEYRILDSDLVQAKSLIGFSIQETDSSTTVSEDGTADSFTIVLNSQPTSDVVINVIAAANDEIEVPTTAVTFTPQNWNTPQVVTVTGVDDSVADLDQLSFISLSVDAALSDSAFAGVATQSVVTTTLDNEGDFGGILPAIRVNNIAYLVHRSTSQIERFDVENGVWLAPIIPAGGSGHPTAALVNEFGIYLAFGKAVYRYSLDGTQRTHVVNAEYEVHAIHSDGNLLFLNQSNYLYARFISVSASTNTIIDTIENYVDAVVGSAIAPRLNRIIGRSSGISPADITYVDYDDSGHFTTGGDSPYHGSFPGASQVWISPKGDRAIDNAGIVYSTDSLRYVSSIGGEPTDVEANPTDVDFIGTDVPVILQGNVLTALSQAYLPTGSVTLDRTPSEIVIGSDSVFAFSIDTSELQGVHVQRVPLTDLKPATPGAPIDPTGLAYQPDAIDVASDGTVLLFSSALSSIFRWDPQSRRYVDTIPLLGSPDFEAYSSVTNTVYLAYHNGLIQKIDLNSADPVEVPFARLPQQPTGLATAGEFLFASDPSGAWGSHYTFSPAGTMISAVEWNYYSTEYIWNPANRRMYFFRDDTSPNDLHFETISVSGSISGAGESPLHGSTGFEHPIRVSPDGKTVVLGSGVIHDGLSLGPVGQIQGAIIDASWLDKVAFTVSNGGGKSLVKRWTNNSSNQPTTLDIVDEFEGVPRALKALSKDEMLLVTASNSGVPEFRVLANDLTLIANDLQIVPLPDNTSPNGLPKIRWNALPQVTSYQVQIIDSAGRVTETSLTAETSLTLNSPLKNGQYRTRVRATLADGTVSGWSVAYTFAVNANTLMSPFTRSTISLPKITWQGRDDAVSYEIWINNLDSRNLFHRMTGIQQPAYTMSQAIPAGRYAVWVRSFDASGVSSIWSDRREFDVNALPVNTTSGHGNTNDSTPTLTWNGVPNAQTYEITIQNAARQTVWRRTGITQTSYTVNTPLAPGRYTVWVQASGYGHLMSVWGPGTQLVVQAAPVVTFANKVITWPTVADATSYNLQVYQYSSGELLFDFPNTSLQRIILPQSMRPGKYEIRSSSNYSGGSTSETRYSQIEVFHAPVLITSDPSPTTDQTPTLTWNESTGASSYEVVIFSLTNTEIYRRRGIVGTLHRVDVPLPLGIAQIWVRSSFSDGSRSEWADAFLLKIGPAPIVKLKEGILSWAAVKDATNYDLWINYTDSKNKVHRQYIRYDLLVTTSFTLPSLPRGKFSVWLRAVRAESGQRYFGAWSSELGFSVAESLEQKRNIDELNNMVDFTVLRDGPPAIDHSESISEEVEVSVNNDMNEDAESAEYVANETCEFMTAMIDANGEHTSRNQTDHAWATMVDSVMMATSTLAWLD